MGMQKALIKALRENHSLQKKEDPQAYKKLASTGLILAHPVKINGHDKRHDNDIKYHASIKFFDKENDSSDEAHKTASKLDLSPPNPKEVSIEPKVLKDRLGNDVYALGLHGKHADKMKEHHNKFNHMGHKENYKWGAHISVPKDVHDEIKSKGHKTAHDAGIEFGHAELKRGNKIINTYKHEKLGKSEKEEIKIPSKINLEKGEKDISEKSLSQIQEDTAWTWASRAVACYQRLIKTGEWKWKVDAEEYRHEALEHAALIGDTHPHTLEQIHKALEEYKHAAKDETKELNKSEFLTKEESAKIHKPGISQPHFLFSAENPRHINENKLGLTHEKTLSSLRAQGFDAHEVKGHYGSPERSILVHGVSPEHAEKLHQMASKLGQDSSIYSTGKQHEMRFHHGENKDKSHFGLGTEFHEKKPADYYTTLPGNEGHFTHNFDFTLLHPSKKIEKSDEEKHLVHFSSQPNLTHIDPKFMGTGQDVTAGRDTWHPHSFYYLHGTEPEKETDVGKKPYKYHVKLDPKEHPIYDIGKDPHGLVRQSIEENNGAHNMDMVHQKIKSAGFHGFNNSTHDRLSNVIAMYHPLPVHNHEEMSKSEILEKGGLRNLLLAGAAAGAIASPAVHAPTNTPNAYSRDKMMNAISQIESSNGKNTAHKPTSQGTAYGRWALMPNTIHETINLNPDLKNKHGKALKLKGPDLSHYLQDNPNLEQELVQRHLSRLEHHFGPNPTAIAAAWNQGISGTNKALKDKKDVNHIPYVKKFKRAYEGGK